jgi:hypothetical protein
VGMKAGVARLRASIGTLTLADRSVPVHCVAVRFGIISIYA